MSFSGYNAKKAAAVAAIALLSGGLFFTTAARADSSCDAVKQAISKMANAPSFTMTQLVNGKPGPVKVIGDANGIHGDDGKKRERIGERADFVKKMQQSLDTANFSKCKIVRSDTIEGKAMNVYTYATGPGKSETMWVGKKDGRAYRAEDNEKNGMIATYQD